MLRATICSVGAWCVMTHAGAQTFGDPQVLYVGFGTTIFADMEPDGLIDFLVQRSDTLYELHNNGSGFDDPNILVPLGPSTTVKGMVDLDGDQRLDVIVAHRYQDGNGVDHDSIGVIWLDEQPIRTHVDTSGSINTIYLAYMDGDEHPDLVCRGSYDTGIIVNFNIGDRTFFAQDYPSVSTNGGVVLGFFHPFDWDGDGDTDLMGGIGLNGNVAVSYNIDGQLGYPFVEVDAGINVPPQSDVVDLDADGTLDFIAANTAYLRSPAGVIDIKCCFASNLPKRELGNLDCDPAIEIVGPGYSDHGNGFAADLVIWDWSTTGFSTRRVLFDPTFIQLEMDLVDLNNDGLDDIVYRNNAPFVYDTLFYRINETTEPEVAMEPPAMVLPADTVIQLTWGQPEGGLYNGPGVFDNTLYVALANSGALEITYTYSDPLTTCISEVSSTLQTAVGIRPQATPDAYSIFPNPTDGNINYRPTFSGNAWVKIDDAMGRTIVERSAVRLEQGQVLNIPLNALANGHYVLEVHGPIGEMQRLRFLRLADGH